MNQEPKLMRIAILVAAAVFSVPVFILGIIAIPFSDGTGGLYNGIIKWGFVAAISILPAFVLVLFSLRLLAWYLRMAALLIYSSEFLIIWTGCTQTHCSLGQRILEGFLMPAIGAFIAPQVFLAIFILALVEYLYHWERLHGAQWDSELY